jgi:hypothetical protein
MRGAEPRVLSPARTILPGIDTCAPTVTASNPTPHDMTMAFFISVLLWLTFDKYEAT